MRQGMEGPCQHDDYPALACYSSLITTAANNLKSSLESSPWKNILCKKFLEAIKMKWTKKLIKNVVEMEKMREIMNENKSLNSFFIC